jgi:perosamine synthetase
VNRRVELATRYNRLLSDHPSLRTPYIPPYVEPNFQSYAIAIKDDCHIERDKLWQALLDAGVAAKRGVMAIHRESSYTETYGRHILPLTEKASDNSLLLPLFPQMTVAEQDHVVAALERALKYD